MNKSLFTNVVSLSFIFLGKFSPLANNTIFTMGLYSFSGAITNWLAIHMLFEKVPLLYGSGIIPNKFEEFKMGIKSLVMEEFFNQENITLFLKQTEEKSRESIQRCI